MKCAKWFSLNAATDNPTLGCVAPQAGGPNLSLSALDFEVTGRDTRPWRADER